MITRFISSLGILETTRVLAREEQEVQTAMAMEQDRRMADQEEMALPDEMTDSMDVLRSVMALAAVVDE